jgi:hypothetical protein
MRPVPLQLKRRGLSKFWVGKSASFASLDMDHLCTALGNDASALAKRSPSSLDPSAHNHEQRQSTSSAHLVSTSETDG